ncbi:rubrerythrin [bacterium DOLJORAL78_65_58]|nr:MAG: rubrerythrin [bacterium DOLZORAL124_64_63]PIE75563.1 MAG: rubrerythrin [bacterium DOLJORAL78_65_58]
MTDLNNLDEILDYAIAMEQQAVELYTDIAERATSEHNRRLFMSFADEERGHKLKLENVKKGKIEIGSTAKVQDLKIADYANDVVIDAKSSYQDILMFAMKQEKQAYRLYTDLAQRATSPEIRDLFLALAHEEANHKLRFEIEYDERVLREN